MNEIHSLQELKFLHEVLSFELTFQIFAYKHFTYYNTCIVSYVFLLFASNSFPPYNFMLILNDIKH